jgi:hypothetical protein
VTKQTFKAKEAVLIQWADGAVYREMLAASNARHTEYARQHGFDFWSVSNNVAGVRLQWQKFALLLKAFSQGYKFAVYLDADCLIVDTVADLREALAPDGELGMVFGQAPGGEPPHFNVGAIFARNVPPVVDLFERMLNRQPKQDKGGVWWDNPDNEQFILNALLKEPEFEVLCKPLASVWNFVQGVSSSASVPIVLAWHGVPDEQAKLQRLIAALNR